MIRSIRNADSRFARYLAAELSPRKSYSQWLKTILAIRYAVRAA